MPADDQGTIAVTIETQPGLKIEEVDKILQRAEDYVTQDPDLDSYMLSYGSSGLSMIWRKRSDPDGIFKG